MTTLVYRAPFLCADTLICADGTISGYAPKIVRHKRSGACGGVVGSLHQCAPWLIAFEKRGFVPKSLPPMKDSTAFVVLRNGTVWEQRDEGWYTYSAPFYVLGSGADIALGALEMGATAEEAVKAAIMWDTNTGGSAMILKVGSNK